MNALAASEMTKFSLGSTGAVNCGSQRALEFRVSFTGRCRPTSLFDRHSNSLVIPEVGVYTTSQRGMSHLHNDKDRTADLGSPA